MGFCEGDLGIVASWGDGLGEIVDNMVHYGVFREAERRFITRGWCIRPRMGRDAQFS